MEAQIESPIGFSDSELDSYSRSGGVVLVRVKSWNERLLVVRFRDAIGLRDLSAGSFSGAVRGSAASAQFLREALECSYTALPTAHPYHVYSFLNADDEPALEVVAAGCEVTVDPQLELISKPPHEEDDGTG
jgi:hypothetical protein